MKVGYLNNIIQRIPVKRACQGYYVRWWYNGWHYWFFLPGRLSLATEGEKYRTLGTRRIAMGTGQITREQCDAIRTITNTREIYLYTTIGWMNLRVEQGSINIYDNRISGDEFDFIAIVGSREDYFSPVVTLPDSPSNPTKYIYGFEGIYITHHTDVFTMILTGDGDITIYWGDGTVETYTLTDVPLVITHTYVDGIPEHTIGIDGEENIITLDASGNNITEIIIPPSCTSLTELILDDNELTDVYIPPTVPLEVLTLTNNPLTVCEVVVGTQIWMCYNYDSDFPGSKVYNNDEANRAIYGGLYTYDQVVTAGFVPAMWHVPTKAEWESLITFVGGAATAGGELKEIGTTHWDAPNTGAVDTYGFAARGGGAWIYVFGIGMSYYNLKKYGYFWADSPVGFNYAFYCQYDSGAITLLPLVPPTDLNYAPYLSVRLLKNFIYKIPTPVVKDYDGNIYYAVTIGTQQWLVQNFRCEHYIDGTPIPNLTLNADWTAEDGTAGHDGAYCYYDNDEATYKPDYGALYNWYAVDNAHGFGITGWRVPSEADFTTLETFLGGAAIAGGKLKEVGLTHWDAPNTGATDEYGFKGLPGGGRDNIGLFDAIHAIGIFWTTTDIPPVRIRLLIYNASDIITDGASYIYGLSIRLMRDI